MRVENTLKNQNVTAFERLRNSELLNPTKKSHQKTSRSQLSRHRTTKWWKFPWGAFLLLYWPCRCSPAAGREGGLFVLRPQLRWHLWMSHFPGKAQSPLPLQHTCDKHRNLCQKPTGAHLMALALGAALLWFFTAFTWINFQLECWTMRREREAAWCFLSFVASRIPCRVK